MVLHINEGFPQVPWLKLESLDNRANISVLQSKTSYFCFRQAPIGDDNYLLLASNIAKFSNSGGTGEVDKPVRKTSSSPCWPWVLFPGMKGRSGIGSEASCNINITANFQQITVGVSWGEIEPQMSRCLYCSVCFRFFHVTGGKRYYYLLIK